MTETEPRVTAWPRWMSIPRAVWMLALLLALPLPFLVRAWFLSQVPDIGDPFDVAEFCKSHDVAPEDDALVAYGTASMQYHIEHREQYLRLQSVGNWEPTTPIKEAINPVLDQGWGVAEDYVKEWMAAHEPSLLEWKKGSERDHVRFNPTLNLLNYQFQHDFQSVETAARLRGRQCEAEHDFAEAFDLYRARLRLREHLWGGTRGDYERESKDVLRWAAIPEVTSAQLRNARSQLHRDHAAIKPDSDAIKRHYILAMNTLTDRDGLTTWIRYGSGNQSAMTTQDRIKASIWRTAYWVCGEPERTRRLCQHVRANQLRGIDLPAPQRRPTYFVTGTLMYLDDPAVLLPPGQLNVGQLAAAIQSSVLHDRLEYTGKNGSGPILFRDRGLDMFLLEYRGFRVLMELQLALQSYYRNHGEFPAKLEDLVPDDIDAVPVDPCDPASLSIRYRRDSSGQATVWSVGNNGTDENGVRNFVTGDVSIEILAPAAPGAGASRSSPKPEE